MQRNKYHLFLKTEAWERFFNSGVPEISNWLGKDTTSFTATIFVNATKSQKRQLQDVYPIKRKINEAEFFILSSKCKSIGAQISCYGIFVSHAMNNILSDFDVTQSFDMLCRNIKGFESEVKLVHDLTFPIWLETFQRKVDEDKKPHYYSLTDAEHGKLVDMGIPTTQYFGSKQNQVIAPVQDEEDPKQNKFLQEALKDFKNAWSHLSAVWTEAEPLQAEAVQQDFPEGITKSFSDLNNDVDLWVCKSVSRLQELLSPPMMQEVAVNITLSVNASQSKEQIQNYVKHVFDTYAEEQTKEGIADDVFQFIEIESVREEAELYGND